MFSKDVLTLKMIPLIIRIFSFYNNQLHFSDSMSLRVIPKVCSSAGLMPSSCRFLVCSALVVGVCIRKQGIGGQGIKSEKAYTDRNDLVKLAIQVTQFLDLLFESTLMLALSTETKTKLNKRM